MLISKFDLYRREWLELVFESRNKEYGAYDLRQHYANNMIRAMGITFLSVGLLFGASIIFRSKPVPVIQAPQPPIITVTLTEKPIVIQPRKTEPVKPPTQPKTTADLPPVVGPDRLAITPPVINAKIEGEIGPVPINGKAGASVLPIDNPGNGTATKPGPDDSVHPFADLDAMPAPVGGEAAWSKFLNKNLRYPVPAQEDGVSGKVILSFIIEKDGCLSNIAVDRPAGHGFDEEALRVLKLAKAWTPAGKTVSR